MVENPDSGRAEVLLEALPYIQKFHGKTIVIKYGGAAMEQAALQDKFARDVVLLRYVGMRPVIVHGGGPRINRLLDRLGIASQFVDGHRVTDHDAMEVAEMVLSGNINKEIVSLINREGGHAVGISGRDGHLATATEHSIEKSRDDGSTEKVSLGRVGTVNARTVKPDLIQDLIDREYIPVIAPIAADENGESMNVNADTMAGAIASALKAEKLILLTDTRGILDGDKTLTGLTPKNVDELIQKKIISGGMLPKTRCCTDALQAGVRRAHIIDGRVPHALLLEIFTDHGVGTLITPEVQVWV